MIFIKKFNEGWFKDNLEEMSDSNRKLIISFSKPFKDIKKLISNWKLIDNKNKIYSDLNNIIDTAIDNLRRDIPLYDKKTLMKLWLDLENFILNFKNSLFKDLSKKYESIESNLKEINKILIEIFDIFIENFDYFKSEFVKAIKSEDYKGKLDQVFSKMKESTLTDIKRLVKNNDNGDNNIDINLNDLKPGEKITYKKKNGEHEIAEIAYSNNDNDNEDLVKINNYKSTFYIKKSNIISRVDDTISPTEIKNKIDNLSNSEIKKVRDYIKNLKN